LYEILEVSPSATQEEIKKNYHYLLHAYHPDKFPGEELKQKAEIKTKELIKAYEILCNPQKRKVYDVLINASREPNQNIKTNFSYSESEVRNHKTNQSSKDGSTPSSKNKHQENADIKTGVCQNCQKITKIQSLRFSRVHTILFFYYRKITKKGSICGKCSIELFWKFTCITLLFGWLGIGLLPSIMVLISNFINFFKSKNLRDSLTNKLNIAFVWKITTISIIFLTAYLLVLPKINDFNKQQNPNENSSSSTEKDRDFEDNTYEISITSTPKIDYLDMVKTREARYEKNEENNNDSPNSSTCSKWNEISSFDVGKTMCVYGTVYDSYRGGDIFYIRFSDKQNSFRFIVLNNYYFKDINNKCIQATGLIEKEGDLLYMILGDRLYPCD